jgi:DNA-binding transcriptional LysR family regulator
MELRQLTYFAKVAELCSVSKAAAVLHMTQPSLTRQVASLERELGYRLFVRNPRGVALTAEGAGLLEHLDAVFGHIERIPEVMRAAAESRKLVRIGVPQGLPQHWGVQLLQEVSELIPQVSVSLHEATTDEQRELVHNGLIDLALLHMEAPELRSVQVLTQELGVAVPLKSPLAARAAVGFADLDGLRVMAHAVGEINIEENRLRSASTAAGACTDWVFRKFAEHTALIAMTSRVDAVLVTNASAARHLHDWRWVPIHDRDSHGQTVDIRTWAAWRESAREHVRMVVDLMAGLSSVAY